MSRWTDLATWRGPTVNQKAGHVECRGLVVHIASGFFEGTISWEKNADADVSSHFVLDRDGTLAQLVDTDDTAWTQRAGNGHWLSVECAGFAAGDKQSNGQPWLAKYPGWDKLTDQQIDAVARLLVKGHQQYGYPLQLAGTPAGKGLGYHSMGAEHGYDWGHLYCPGEPIKAQLPAILACALTLAGQPTTSQEDDVELTDKIPGAQFNATDFTRNLGQTELDQWLALDPYTKRWQNETLFNTRDLLAQLAGLAAKVDGLVAAVQALASGGTSVDTAAVIAAVNTRSSEESAAVTALQQQVADLQARLAAAAQGAAGALAG